MTKKPLITVVMPNYNGEKYVGQAIQSVINQSYTKFELIVIDDKSTDNSPCIVEQFVKKDSRVHIIYSDKNNGVAITRNIGIQRAKGEYIALIDNDDLWERDKLERQVALASDGADIIYCSYDFIDENNRPIGKPFVVPTSTELSQMLSSSVISCSTAFIKTELLKEHPFNPKFYHEDYVLWMELLSLPVNAVGDKKVLMHYRQVNGSRSNKKRNAAIERWNIYRKALHLNMIKSVCSFLSYSMKGLIKYYF